MWSLYCNWSKISIDIDWIDPDAGKFMVYLDLFNISRVVFVLKWLCLKNGSFLKRRGKLTSTPFSYFAQPKFLLSVQCVMVNIYICGYASVLADESACACGTMQVTLTNSSPCFVRFLQSRALVNICVHIWSTTYFRMYGGFDTAIRSWIEIWSKSSADFSLNKITLCTVQINCESNWNEANNEKPKSFHFWQKIV